LIDSLTAENIHLIRVIMGETRKFTILHSNDMHGDFLAEVKAGSVTLLAACYFLP